MVLFRSSHTRVWEPIHKRIYNRDSNFMEIPFYSHPIFSEVIAMQFCKCAVVPWTKFRSDMIPYKELTLNSSFNRIWITMEKSFVRWPLERKLTVKFFMWKDFNQDKDKWLTGIQANHGIMVIDKLKLYHEFMMYMIYSNITIGFKWLINPLFTFMMSHFISVRGSQRRES